MGFLDCRASAGFLTRYERELREPLVWCQGLNGDNWPKSVWPCGLGTAGVSNVALIEVLRCWEALAGFKTEKGFV